MGSVYEPIAIAGGDTAQPLAMRKRLRVIEAAGLPKGARFLDGGCGAGEYVFALIEELGLDAEGVEYEAAKVQRARQHPAYGSRITEGNLEALHFQAERFAGVMLNEVLEHVPDEAAALQEVRRVLQPGGLLFIFSPNRWFPFETHSVQFRGSGRRLPHWVPLVPYLPLRLGQRFLKYWARNYWQRELQQLVRDAGFTIVKTGFLWQTFEGISGRQPRVIRLLRPLLRGIAGTLEALPFLNRFGVSQVLVGRKE